MLKRVIDCRKRCACYVDALTGRVEHEWKRVRTKTWIPIGGVYQIERDGTVTILDLVRLRKLLAGLEA